MRLIPILVLLAFTSSLSVLSQTKSNSKTVRGRTAPAVKNSGTAVKSKPKLADNSTVKPSSSDVLPPPPPLDLKAKAAEDQVIKVDTNLVTTPVSVLDRQGRFIPGLKKRDFKIFDNGVQQDITYFQSEEQPFTVILMIDISPSTKYHIDDIHYAAVTFVNQLRPNDKVMVVAFDSRVKALTEEPTNEKQKLFGAIYKAQFGSGTSLYDAVAAVSELDLMNIPGRKAVVLFTDGVDTTSQYASFESTLAGIEEIDALFYPVRYNTQQNGGVVSTATGASVAMPPDVAALMKERGIQIDPRAYRGPRGSSPAEYAKGKLYLEGLAESTGGRIFEADTISNLETSFAGIAEELRRQYSVGYYPDDTGKPGDRRQIKIQVARPNIVVRSKKTYVISGPPKTETSGD